MSELYNQPMNADVLNAAVKAILDKNDGRTPLAVLLAEQIAMAFEDGLRVGLNMRCNELVSEVPKIAEGHDVMQAIHHTDLCVLQAQAVCFGVIPGIIELPELITDYGHKCFAAGFDQGYSEGWTDGTLSEDEEETA